MKLLIISTEFPPGPGGIGTHAMQIGAQLSALGWEVVVATPQDYAPAAEIEAFNAQQPFRVVRLRHVPGPPIEAAYRHRTIAKIIRDWQPDAMLASGERSVWLASRLSRIRGTPWIAVGHGTEFGTRSRWERALTRTSFGNANAVVCVSEYTRSRMHAAGIHGRREHVIPNGADPSAFRVLQSKAESGEARSAVLLTVGNVTERKGQEVVIRALPSLPDVRYEMVGLPTRAPELTALARELGVADRIEFVGRASPTELVRRLNNCDLFVMTSRNTAGGDFEGFGIAVVEAALCGKPAIVSDGSGLSEAIIAGETALVVREGDSADTARAIKEVLADPARLKKMGAAAHAYALAEQTWAHRAVRYDAVLREAMRPPGRKIVVISDTPHYRRAGRIVGWGPTVRELDHLSMLFDELVHVAPVSDETAPASALPYASARIRMRPLRPSGGERLVDKFGILNCAPEYLGIALSEMKDAEVVHLRCPASVSMLVAFVLPFLRRPVKRWIKYAGNWNPRGEEPVSYELQRRWLMKPWHRAVVTVNGNWPEQPAHVHAFLNPCLTDQELAAGQTAASAKQFDYPVRMLFVGRLEEAKGVQCALDVLTRLSRLGFAVQLELVGDGPARPELERLARERGVSELLTFAGWVPHGALAPHYAKAHLMLFPSRSEGWPKVLSEAMAFGVVPVASRVSSIPEYLVRFDIGTVADPDDIEGFVDGVRGYLNAPDRWRHESPMASAAAAEFTYDRYLGSVRTLLALNSAESTAGD
jgi:phosphatidylinositol alpha-1,6-mannosyltransferase